VSYSCEEVYENTILEVFAFQLFEADSKLHTRRRENLKSHVTRIRLLFSDAVSLHHDVPYRVQSQHTRMDTGELKLILN
jgi:hypothetical protein